VLGLVLSRSHGIHWRGSTGTRQFLFRLSPRDDACYEKNELLNPADVGFLGFIAMLPSTNCLMDLIEQAWFWRVREMAGWGLRRYGERRKTNRQNWRLARGIAHSVSPQLSCYRRNGAFILRGWISVRRNFQSVSRWLFPFFSAIRNKPVP
jgi:hypothetical protein